MKLLDRLRSHRISAPPFLAPPKPSGSSGSGSKHASSGLFSKSSTSSSASSSALHHDNGHEPMSSPVAPKSSRSWTSRAVETPPSSARSRTSRAAEPLPCSRDKPLPVPSSRSISDAQASAPKVPSKSGSGQHLATALSDVTRTALTPVISPSAAAGPLEWPSSRSAASPTPPRASQASHAQDADAPGRDDHDASMRSAPSPDARRYSGEGFLAKASRRLRLSDSSTSLPFHKADSDASVQPMVSPYCLSNGSAHSLSDQSQASRRRRRHPSGKSSGALNERPGSSAHAQEAEGGRSYPPSAPSAVFVERRRGSSISSRHPSSQPATPSLMQRDFAGNVSPPPRLQSLPPTAWSGQVLMDETMRERPLSRVSSTRRPSTTEGSASERMSLSTSGQTSCSTVDLETPPPAFIAPMLERLGPPPAGFDAHYLDARVDLVCAWVLDPEALANAAPTASAEGDTAESAASPRRRMSFRRRPRRLSEASTMSRRGPLQSSVRELERLETEMLNHVSRCLARKAADKELFKQLRLAEVFQRARVHLGLDGDSQFTLFTAPDAEPCTPLLDVRRSIDSTRPAEVRDVSAAAPGAIPLSPPPRRRRRRPQTAPDGALAEDRTGLPRGSGAEAARRRGHFVPTREASLRFSPASPPGTLPPAAFGRQPWVPPPASGWTVDSPATPTTPLSSRSSATRSGAPVSILCNPCTPASQAAPALSS